MDSFTEIFAVYHGKLSSKVIIISCDAEVKTSLSKREGQPFNAENTDIL